MTEIKVGDRVRYDASVRGNLEITSGAGVVVSILPPLGPDVNAEYAKDPLFGRIRRDEKDWDDLVYRDEIELLDD
jgi:hypothetical protein